MAFTSFSDSVPAFSDTVQFRGLWMHFPDNPRESSVNFLYGKDLRSYEIDVGGSQLVLAGRKFPVSEFGEHQKDLFKVQVVIPHGPEYEDHRQALREFATSKQTLVARDNRGVVLHGSMSSLSEDHQKEGSAFSFDVKRVHREEIRVD